MCEKKQKHTSPQGLDPLIYGGGYFVLRVSCGPSGLNRASRRVSGEASVLGRYRQSLPYRFGSSRGALAVLLPRVGPANQIVNGNPIKIRDPSQGRQAGFFTDSRLITVVGPDGKTKFHQKILLPQIFLFSQ